MPASPLGGQIGPRVDLKVHPYISDMVSEVPALREDLMAKYHTTVDEVAPEPMAEKDGWRRVDYRILLGRHNVGSTEGCLYRSVFPPGGVHKKHLHTKSDELVYVIRGRGAHGQGDDEWEVGPGSCYYIPKNVPHWLRNLDPVEPVELVGVYLGAGSLEETGYVFLGEVEEKDIKVH